MSKAIQSLRYLAAERRAEIDRANRSRAKNTRRHERQAIQHDRRTKQLEESILALVNEV